GRWAVVTRLVSRGDNNLYLVDLNTRTETLLTPHEGTGSFGWGEFSPDGRRIYVTSNGGRDMLAFGVIELDGAGKPGPIRILAERPNAEAEGGILSRDGSRAALVWNVAGRSEVEWLDTKKGSLSAGPKLPFDLVGGADFSPDGRTLAVERPGCGRSRQHRRSGRDVRRATVDVGGERDRGRGEAGRIEEVAAGHPRLVVAGAVQRVDGGDERRGDAGHRDVADDRAGLHVLRSHDPHERVDCRLHAF
ncbi:MAG: hypothetical protein KY463_13580, partial [Actinobacteria bacterium]|nr:hypothetical protein [Actinomycetota bacterium]